jgi:hypothetical protein
MGSSGGGDSGYYPGMFGNAEPMPGLPVAGQGSGVNAQEYGQFQSFLPEIQAEGQNPMATGLRPDMFKYRSPTGVVAESNTGNQIEELRGELAKLKAASEMGTKNQFGAGQSGPGWQDPFAQGGGQQRPADGG